MKILFITPGKLPVPAVKGGAVENLIQMLLESNKLTMENEISVVGLKSLEAEKEYNNYKTIKFYDIDTSSYKYKILRFIRYLINRIPYIYIGNEYISKVYKLLKSNNLYYDLIIIENAPEYVLRLKHKFSKKIILHLHNDFLNKNKRQANKILLSFDKILCLSNYVSNRVKEINSNYKNISTVYNGIDINNFKKIDTENLNEYRKKYEIQENNFVYIYSGRITKEKGVLELIKAFNMLSLEQKNIKLLICGSIRKDKYFKKIIKESQSNKNIVFTNYINYSELVYLYNIANVGVVPSIVEEGFGLIVIENMACGNPVIISNSGGMPELVNPSVGRIVDKNIEFVENLYKKMKEIQKIKFDDKTIIEHSHMFTKEKYIDSFIESLGDKSYEN